MLPSAARAAIPGFLEELRGPEYRDVLRDYVAEYLLIPTDDQRRKDGQAMESLVVHGMLAYFAMLTSWGQGKRAVLVGGAAVLVILIGFSRAYLGAHYFSDVAGGFAAGGAWLSAVITGRDTMRRHEMASRRDRTGSS